MMNHLYNINGSSSSLSDTVSANDDESGGGAVNNNDNNSNRSSSSCKYTGVRKRKWGKWVTEIRLPNSRERIWLGSYDTPEKAARAFDAAQFCLRGKSANFNFPNDPPDIPGGRSMSRQEIQEAAARFANLTTTNQNGEENEENRNNESNHIDMAIDHSPTLSQETFQMDNSEVLGVERSFHEQLSLSATFGSGNYVSEYGYFTDYMANDYQMTSEPENFDYMTSDYQNISQPDNYGYSAEDTYDNSVYQHSYLWNF